MQRIAPPLFMALASMSCAVMAFAQSKATPSGDYPTKPIRVIVSISPGGGPDIIARMVSQIVQDKLGQPFVVDNRTGAASVIATDIVAHAAPDGYTLLSSSDTLLLAGALKRVAYDVRKAFDPVVQMTSQPYLMVITPSLPVKTVKELIAYGKARPNALNYASQGVGSTPHTAMERFKNLTSTQMVHVPYKGTAPAFLDVMAGQVHLILSSPMAAAQHVVNGKVRALAVCGPKRLTNLPELPTMAEAGLPEFSAGNSYNLVAPAGTPRHAIQTLNRVISAGLNTPEMVKRLAADGTEPAAPASPEEFRAHLLREYEQVEKLVKLLSLKP